MNKKHKSASPSEIQVKNQWKTVSIKEKLDVISRLEKGEQIVHICCNVIFACSNICAICDNADRIRESAKPGLKCLWSKTTTVLLEWTLPKTGCFLHFYCII